MNETITLSQAATKLGVLQQTLTQWLYKGLVDVPGWRRQHGAEVPLMPKHMRELGIVRDLRRAGVSLQAIRRAARFLRKLGANPFSKGQFFVVAKGEVVRVTDEDGAIALLHEPGQLVLIPVSSLDKTGDEPKRNQ